MALYCTECGSRLEAKQAFGKLRDVCPNCGKVHFEDPKVAVGVVVDYGGRVVLGKSGHEPNMGRWSFPSGYVDAGEKVEDAAAREVEEETGIKVRIDKLLGVYSTPGERTIYIAFAGRAIGGELTAGEECIEVGAFEPEAVPPLAFPHDNTILDAWVRQRTSLNGAGAAPPEA